MTDRQREAIEALKEMDCVTVGPELIAQAMGVSPGVLRKHVRDGDYLVSEVDVCGSRIRFFRKDFLQKIGEIPPDPPEKTDSDRLDEIILRLEEIANMFGSLLQGQSSMMRALGILLEKEVAGAATPTD